MKSVSEIFILIDWVASVNIDRKMFLKIDFTVHLQR